MRHSVLTLFSALGATCLLSAPPALAELVIPSLTYRVGPYGNSGIPYSDGFSDYFTLLNERDGGINGQKIEVVECEYGYNADEGVKCFDETMAKGALVYHPMSTGLTYKLIPLANKAGVTLHTMGYGLTAASDGESFPYVFNFPAHYWHAASAQIRHLKEQAGGSLEGKTIVHLHHNSGYGKEPIPTLEKLAEIEGFTLKVVPVDHPGEDQTAAWDEIKGINPDYILLWGWGIMNEIALRSAHDIGFPMENVMGIWWSANEDDVRALRNDANGYKAVTFHAVGTRFGIYNDLNMLVYQTGKARGELNNIGDVLYNRGLASAMFSAQAIRNAMEIHGTNEVTREMVRDGHEKMVMKASDFNEIGMEGFLPGLEVSCANHAGEGLVAVVQWDARQRRWKQISDYYEPEAELIGPQVKAAAKAFLAKNDVTTRKCE